MVGYTKEKEQKDRLRMFESSDYVYNLLLEQFSSNRPRFVRKELSYRLQDYFNLFYNLKAEEIQIQIKSLRLVSEKRMDYIVDLKEPLAAFMLEIVLDDTGVQLAKSQRAAWARNAGNKLSSILSSITKRYVTVHSVGFSKVYLTARYS